MELDDYWEEGIEDIEGSVENFGQTSTTRWFKTYDVYIDDANAKSLTSKEKFIQRIFQINDKFPGFFIHFSICSPALASNPPKGLAQEMQHAVVQDIFNEEAAHQELNIRLSQIEATSLADLKAKIGDALYILPSKK